MRNKVILCWSSGKDSAWALDRLRRRDDAEVVGLMTTVTAGAENVPMHGVPLGLVRLQAEAAGLPLHVVPIPVEPDNATYDAAMARFVEEAVAAGVRQIAFGDLFLEDVRAYRESRLHGSGLEPIFPLWGIPTGELARTMIAGGLCAHLVSVDTQAVAAGLVGRPFDAALLDVLPADADPCGERGEFHTFVYDAPIFSRPIPFVVGPTHSDGRFVRQEIAPHDPASGHREADVAK